jgi:hypothetical protein
MDQGISVISQNLALLIVKMQKYFQFCPDWYRRSEAVGDLVGQYYVILRCVLRDKPRLRRRLTRCRFCRIFFLSHSCNAGRRDLRCPFGCRRAYRQRCSKERSVAYYRTPEGKRKKRLCNSKRKQKQLVEAPKMATPEPQEAEPIRLPAKLIHYLRIVTSWIEGRRVSEPEILQLLERAMRQHSLARRRRIDYVLSCWYEHVPERVLGPREVRLAS